MPTLRTRVGRHRARQISDIAAEAFKTAMPLRLHREEAISDIDFCLGIGRCATCDQYEEAVATIARELHVPPHDTDPIDVVDCPPPPWFDKHDAVKWEVARKRYCALCDAAGIKRSKRAEISDTVRSHRNIRWIERHSHVPEGRDAGMRVRLRGFQREAIRRIYGNGFGKDGDEIKTALER